MTADGQDTIPHYIATDILQEVNWNVVPMQNLLAKVLNEQEPENNLCSSYHHSSHYDIKK